MLVLVTGATGYVGRAVVPVLREHGHQVRTLNRPHEDLLKPETIRADVDAVVHLAAKTSVRDSVANPTAVWRTNVMGTLNLLDALPNNGARLVFASTGSVYGAPAEQPIAETAPTAPLNPYGAAKLAAEHLIGAQTRTGALGAVTLRLFSAAGRPDADLSRIIPKVLAVAAGHEPAVTVNGDGRAIRDFVHVDDLAVAVVRALEAARPGTHTIYNVGAIPASVADIIAAAERVTGRPVPVNHHEANPGEARELRADTTKIRTELGWAPVHTTLDELIAGHVHG
jgi:UDP-glucose 4-epimerase